MLAFSKITFFFLLSEKGLRGSADNKPIGWGENIHQAHLIEDCYCYPTVTVAVLRGKVSRQLGAKEDHRVTPHNKPHTSDLLGKTQRVAASAEAEAQGAEPEASFL